MASLFLLGLENNLICENTSSLVSASSPGFVINMGTYYLRWCHDDRPCVIVTQGTAEEWNEVTRVHSWIAGQRNMCLTSSSWLFSFLSTAPLRGDWKNSFLSTAHLGMFPAMPCYSRQCSTVCVCVCMCVCVRCVCVCTTLCANTVQLAFCFNMSLFVPAASVEFILFIHLCVVCVLPSFLINFSQVTPRKADVYLYQWCRL